MIRFPKKKFMFHFLLISCFSIEEVTEDDFNEYENAKQPILAYFYSKKNIKDFTKTKLPIFEDSSLFFKDTKFVTIECNKEHHLCDRMAIVSNPTIKYLEFSPKPKFTVFDNIITQKNIFDFVEKMNGEKPSYNHKNVVQITPENIQASKAKQCNVFFAYSQDSIQGINFFELVRNVSLIYEPSDNVSFSTLNCTKYPDLCNDFDKMPFPAIGLYRNNSFDSLLQETLSDSLELINYFCNEKRMYYGYLKPQSCSFYFEKYFSDRKSFTTTFKNEIPQICLDVIKSQKTIEKDINLMAKALRRKDASRSVLDSIYQNYFVRKEFTNIKDIFEKKNEDYL